jgi:hypothetical protein
LLLAITSEPVAPYQAAIPYKRHAELKQPSRKYFIDASEERRLVTRAPHRQYRARDATSTPIKSVKKSEAKIMMRAPHNDDMVR